MVLCTVGRCVVYTLFFRYDKGLLRSRVFIHGLLCAGYGSFGVFNALGAVFHAPGIVSSFG